MQGRDEDGDQPRLAHAVAQIVSGTTLRARPKEQKIAIIADVGQHVWPGVISGDIRPIIHETLPLADAAGAHRALEEGENIGKVLLVVAEVGENA
jgi:NADPH:quinone reductase-like Zn-dependent oxidoreductase